MTREEAIDVLKSMEAFAVPKSAKMQRAKNEALEMAIKALEQQPKTGHWETSGDYFTGAYETIDYVRCSCCGYESLEEGDYCPNCGARMKESEEKE